MHTKKNLILSNQNLKVLSHQLDKLCKFLDEVYNINCGGCCYVAACLAECLQKDNISYQVVVLECPEDIVKFSKIKKSCCHYFLSINNEDTVLSVWNLLILDATHWAIYSLRFYSFFNLLYADKSTIILETITIFKEVFYIPHQTEFLP